MIEWKKYDPNKPPNDHLLFIVCSVDNGVYTAYLSDDPDDGLIWIDDMTFTRPNVTHYAEINLPK